MSETEVDIVITVTIGLIVAEVASLPHREGLLQRKVINCTAVENTD